VTKKWTYPKPNGRPPIDNALAALIERLAHESVAPGSCRVHLPFQHFDLVDGALDPPGAVGQGEACVDGVLIAEQVAGERRHRRQRVPFDVGDPLFEVLAGQLAHHGGEAADMAGETV
jgi:hypothetical protein